MRVGNIRRAPRDLRRTACVYNENTLIESMCYFMDFTVSIGVRTSDNVQRRSWVRRRRVFASRGNPQYSVCTCHISKWSVSTRRLRWPTMSGRLLATIGGVVRPCRWTCATRGASEAILRVKNGRRRSVVQHIVHKKTERVGRENHRRRGTPRELARPSWSADALANSGAPWDYNGVYGPFVVA